MSFLITGFIIGIFGFMLLKQYNTANMQIKQMIAAHDGQAVLTEQDKLEIKNELVNNPVFSKVNYVAVMKLPVEPGKWEPGRWVSIYGEEERENSPLYIYVSRLLTLVQNRWAGVNSNFEGPYVSSVTGSKDWMVEFQYRGYSLLLYYYLIFPLIIIGLALLLLTIGKTINFSNQKRLFKN